MLHGRFAALRYHRDVSAIAPTSAAAHRRFAWAVTHRELLRTLLRRELRARYKGSAIGVLWSYLQPILMMIVYTVVFSVLLKATGAINHYPQFVLSGLAVWTFFQGGIVIGAGSIVGNAHLIKKVWFPRAIVPTAVVLAQGVTATVMLAVLVPLNLIVIPKTASTVLAALPMMLGLLCLTLGLAWAFAAANVFFRDVEHLLGVLFLPWFFLTPIFYSLESLPGANGSELIIGLIRYLNPVTPYVEGIRAAILQGAIVGPAELIYMAVVGPVAAYVGLRILQRYEDQFAVEL